MCIQTGCKIYSKKKPRCASCGKTICCMDGICCINSNSTCLKEGVSVYLFLFLKFLFPPFSFNRLR